MNAIFLVSRIAYEFLRIAEKSISTPVNCSLYCIRLDRMAIFRCSFLGYRPCHTVCSPLSTSARCNARQAESGSVRHSSALFGNRNTTAVVYYRFTSAGGNQSLPNASVTRAAFRQVLAADH